MKNLIITLTILGIVSALSLAIVYERTTPMIKKHQEVAKREAILEVLPSSDSYTEESKNGMIFYEGNRGNEVAVIASGGGFQGQIEIMIGANPESGIIYGIQVLTHSETPGLGANITSEDFESNFREKPFGNYSVVKRPAAEATEVEAISGATISSEKVTNIIEEAIDSIKLAYGGGA
ncbi:MAG: FMN-binding protein [Halanaerobiaceae bacterium]